jgi:MFS transporter, ACS family, glucarate transporter
MKDSLQFMSVANFGKRYESAELLQKKLEPWWLVALLFATATVSYICRVNLSVVGALMMRDLHFSQVDMGQLFSAFVLGYAIFQVPAGLASDKWGARSILIAAALSWSVITVCIASLGWVNPQSLGVSAFAVLLLLRFMLGIGESPTFPAAAQAVSQVISRTKQGLANGIVLASVGAGSALTPIIISRAMLKWNWEIALLVSAALALLVCILWIRYGRNSLVPLRSSAVPNRAKNRKLLWSRSFILLTVSYTIEGYVGYVLIFWFYLYLVDVRHFDLLKAGNLSSLPGILSFFSIPLGGFISDRLISGRLGRTWGRRAVPMTGLALSGLLLALGAETASANMAVIYLTLATGVIFAVEGPFWAAMMDIANGNSGTGGGVMNCGSNIGGLISPALTPILAAHVGWNNALHVAAGLAVLGCLLWLGISIPRSASETRTSKSQGTNEDWHATG